MENYWFSRVFNMNGLVVSPVHVRVEQHPQVIAAHRHSNTSYEIHYAHRGRGTVTVDGVTYDVRPGTLYITGRGVEHAQRCDPNDPVIEYCLYLNCQWTSGSPNEPLALFVETSFWLGTDRGQIYPLLQQLIDEGRAPDPETPEMVEALLRQIIVRLTRVYRQPSGAVPAHPSNIGMSRAGTVFAMEEAFLYRYQSLTLSTLAALLNLSQRQTQRLLRQGFGKTFSQKLTEARMAAAAQLLMGTDLSVTEIAERTGYSSIEHFSTAFHRLMGRTPREYRRQQRS
ncbi:MAG: helix-turn-helix transcriptional regulator [Clostridia bacterium]|nr:helix-turn-helix transcriptional regulator [Clostridia bacterium]